MNWRILAISLPLLLAGCEVEESYQISTSTSEDGKTLESGKPETVAVRTTRFPSDLLFRSKPQPPPVPSDFPLALYPGAELLDVMKSPSMGHTQVFAEIEPIKDSPTVIGDFYRKRLQKTGWTLKQPKRGMPDAVEIPAIKGKQSLTVTIWDHGHDHDQDYNVTNVVQHLNSRATTIWISLYDLDHDAQ